MRGVENLSPSNAGWLCVGVQGLCDFCIPMCTYSDIPVKLNWVMLEECWVPSSPITSWVCYHKCAHPAILRARIRTVTHPQARQHNLCRRKRNSAMAPCTEAAEREGMCPNATASLPLNTWETSYQWLLSMALSPAGHHFLW